MGRAAGPGPSRAEAWAEIERALGRFDTPTGFEGPCELLVGSGSAHGIGWPGWGEEVTWPS
jgi:hypothetical protein